MDRDSDAAVTVGAPAGRAPRGARGERSGAGRGGAGQWAGSGAGHRKLGGLGRGPRKAPPGAARVGTAARGVSHLPLRRWRGDWTRSAQVGPGACARVGGWGIGPGTRRRSTERWGRRRCARRLGPRDFPIPSGDCSPAGSSSREGQRRLRPFRPAHLKRGWGGECWCSDTRTPQTRPVRDTSEGRPLGGAWERRERGGRQVLGHQPPPSSLGSHPPPRAQEVGEDLDRGIW